MLDVRARWCVACDTSMRTIRSTIFIDTRVWARARVCSTFNKIRPTRIHKHRWVATNRVDHHHHACLFSRFGARARFHRGTSDRDKFFSLTTLTFDATGDKFLTLANDIIFFFASRLSSYRSRVAIVENARAILHSCTLSGGANYSPNATTSYRVIKRKRITALFSVQSRSILPIVFT